MSYDPRIGVHDSGMHQWLLDELELGERAALALDAEAIGMGVLDEPWGYCKHCVRLVLLDDDGLLVVHRIARHAICEGSEHTPWEQPGPEAPNEGDYVVKADS